MLSPTVLKSLRSTEPTLYGVVTALQIQRGLDIFGQKFSGKIGKMEYLRRYFNRLTTSYKCGTCMVHSALSNNDEKRFRFFVSDHLNALDFD